MLITKWPLGVSVCIRYFTALRDASSHPPLAEGEAGQHRSSAAWHCRFETYLCDCCLHLFPVVVKKKEKKCDSAGFRPLLPPASSRLSLFWMCYHTFFFPCHQHPLFCSVGTVYYTALWHVCHGCPQEAADFSPRLPQQLRRHIVPAVISVRPDGSGHLVSIGAQHLFA